MELLEFKPILKQARWGGRKLESLLGKTLGSETDFAECWEISDVSASESEVLAGEHVGKTLHQLLQSLPLELLGNSSGWQRFPLLVKFLDAKDRLSVQVHPNDEQAQNRYGALFGKTECWTILHCEPEARLYVGLKQGVDRAALEAAIRGNQIENCLHDFAVHPGDFVFVPAGTVHAIGEGIVLAEIQQTSDTTFRLFDWNRLGQDGKSRELHIEDALDCIDYERGPVSAIPTVVERTDSGTVEELVSCDQFQVRRWNLQNDCEYASEGLMRIWIVVSGSLCVENEYQKLNLQTGNTILAPAASEEYRLCPEEDSQLLEVTLPAPNT